MSGGHFDHEQYNIERVADEIKKSIDDRGLVNKILLNNSLL